MSNTNQTKICILGKGAFGSAMNHMLTKKGYSPVMWGRHDDIKSCVENSSYLIFAIPTQSFREVLEKAAPYTGDAIIVNLAKGIEISSEKRLSQVAEEVLQGCRYVALSGPSHAEEIMLDMPTNVTVSSLNQDILLPAQDLFHTDTFRVYTNKDLIGVELGGAVKNVIALAVGIAEGMGFGDNSRAALITRGLAEMSSLGEALGAEKSTFFGLSGIGDLVVTCGSMHSRNRRCGILLGHGISVAEAKALIGQTVEGIPTCTAVYKLAREHNVEMPITSFLYHFLEGHIRLDDATKQLLSMDKKSE